MHGFALGVLKAWCTGVLGRQASTTRIAEGTLPLSSTCPLYVTSQVTTGEIRLVNADSHQKCFTRGALDWFLVRRAEG